MSQQSRRHANIEVLTIDGGLSLSERMNHSLDSFIAVGPDYEFNCEMCNKLLTDIEAAALHAVTEKHKRQMLYREQSRMVSERFASSSQHDVTIQNVIEPSDDPYAIGRCRLCCVTITDYYQLLQHTGSKRHRSNLDWYQRVHAAKALGKFLPGKDHDAWMSAPMPGEVTYDKILPHSKFLVDEGIARFIHGLSKGIVVREWDYFCVYCDSKLQTEESAIRHTHRQSRSYYDARKKSYH